MTVGSSDASYPAVAKAGGWPGVKFFYALNVDPGSDQGAGPGAARVIVRLADQTPLLLEKRIGEGRVVLLTSGLDNLTNDFPLNSALFPSSNRPLAILPAANARAARVPW